MLIKVFGIWLMANNISHLGYLASDDRTCFIHMNAAQYASSFPVPNTPCDFVAEEINRKIKESK